MAGSVPAPRRHGVGQHLTHGVPVQAKLSGNRPNTFTSTITARRTRRYTSTLYIHRTIGRVDYDPMNGGGRSDLQPPNC